MSNNYFQFKQFIIRQDKTAMKVCTDACLFGAYVAEQIQNKPVTNILDIGTGTGLLSVMLAQKTNAVINAVEIDTNAYEQAIENIENSPWKQKIIVSNTDISDFTPAAPYDFIISNPPFFEDDLPSAHKSKNAAKHSSSLTLRELLNNIDRLLNKSGTFTVLLPYHRVDYFIKESEEKGFYLTDKLLVRQTPAHNLFRGILFFSRINSTTTGNELSIKDEAGNYTNAFTQLLKDYYLYL